MSLNWNYKKIRIFTKKLENRGKKKKTKRTKWVTLEEKWKEELCETLHLDLSQSNPIKLMVFIGFSFYIFFCADLSKELGKAGNPRTLSQTMSSVLIDPTPMSSDSSTPLLLDHCNRKRAATTVRDESRSVAELAANLQNDDGGDDDADDDEFDCRPIVKLSATHDPAQMFDVKFVARRVIAHLADCRPSSRPASMEQLERFLHPHLIIVNECSSYVMFNYLIELGAIAIDQEHRVHVVAPAAAPAIVRAHDERCMMHCTPDWWSEPNSDERRTNELTSDSFAAIASNVLRSLFAQPVAPMNALEFRQLLAHVCISETGVPIEPVVQELVDSGVVLLARRDPSRLRIRLPPQSSNWP
jgi:hypothetical protein